MDKKITQLTQVTELTGAELLPLAQGGVTKSASVDQLRGYQVYTALLTQSGGDDPQSIGSGAVTEGVTYMVDGTGSDADFSNVGGPKYDGVTSINGTYFVAINNDIPNNYSEGQLNYNTGAPVVTVLENTIGNIWFEFYANGQYKINSNGLLFFNSRQFYYGLLKFADSVNGYIIESDEAAYNDDFIQIITLDSSRVAVNGMEKVPIEIRVYN